MKEITSGNHLLSKWIQSTMAIRGHSQADLAKLLQISQGYMSALVTGRKSANGMNTGLARRIARYLDRKRPAVPRRQVKIEGVMRSGEAVAKNRCCG